MREKLTGRDYHPDELDEAMKDAGGPPYLLNFHCAIPVDLSSIGLGRAIFIPVQISQREGGRKSLFYLNQGEEALAGVYVTNQGIALRFMRRETGTGLPAQTGDSYSTRITNREEIPIFEGKGELELTDASVNKAFFHTASISSVSPIPAGNDGITLVCMEFLGIKSGLWEGLQV